MSLLIKVAMDADKGRWVTINGSHIHINEKGEPDKGNPKVIKGMKKSGGKSNNKNQKKTTSNVEKKDELDRPKTKEEAEKIINRVLFPDPSRGYYRTFLSGPGSSHGGTISWQDRPGMFDDKSKFKPGWHDWEGNYLSEEEVLELVKGGGWGFGYT